MTLRKDNMRIAVATGLLFTAISVSSQVCAGDKTPQTNKWVTVEIDPGMNRFGGEMIYDAKGDRALVVGGYAHASKLKGGLAFDFKTRTLKSFIDTNPKAFRNIFRNNNHQTIYIPELDKLYFINKFRVAYWGPENNIAALDIKKKTWSIQTKVDDLNHIMRRTAIYDAERSEIIIIGADASLEKAGWITSSILNVKTGKFKKFEFGTPDEQKAHWKRWGDRDALISLKGKTRLYWYRDKKQEGTDSQRRELLKDLEVILRLNSFDTLKGDFKKVKTCIESKQLLLALKEIKVILRKYEELAEAKAPMPPARANSPIVLDVKKQKGVLFGGDHEDYMMNDTWVLDLKTRRWQRMNPAVAPSPRAGHGFAYLPESGKVILLGGYQQSNSSGYGAGASVGVKDKNLWVYDIKKDEWQVLDIPSSEEAPLGGSPWCSGAGAFCINYRGLVFTMPIMVANKDDLLFLNFNDTRTRKKRINKAVYIQVDTERISGTALKEQGVAGNTRLYRTGRFRAAFCEKADGVLDTGIDDLPDNTWVQLPKVAKDRNPCRGCRQRDWGTAVFDQKNDQILLWGGGHCVRSCSPVAHYSPVTGRIVEGYDADETYGGQGRSGHSIMGRPWISQHSYNYYAFDNNSGLMIVNRGYLYDPVKMDWLKERVKTPFGGDLLEGTPHGVVALTSVRKGAKQGVLWLYQHNKGWTKLEQDGEINAPYVDNDGMTFDTKRDRLILVRSVRKQPISIIKSYSFKTKKLESLQPDNWNEVMGSIWNFREVVYVENADWVIAGSSLKIGGNLFTRVFDMSSNKCFLIDTGKIGFPRIAGMGFSYDKKRKIVIAISNTGMVFALKINPKTAKQVEANRAVKKANR
jgi:Galactose oxidase, central domain